MEMITGGFWLMLDDDQYTGARKLMRHGRDIMEREEANDCRKFVGGVYFMNLPPDPSVPAELHGKPVTACWIGVWGTDDEAMELCRTFQDREIVYGKPPAVMPFHIWNSLMCGPFLAFPPFDTYWKGGFLETLPDELIDEYASEYSTHEPWLNAALVGIDFQGGKAGAEHGRKLVQDMDSEHSVPGLRSFRFVLPILLYFPTGNAEFREKARVMGRNLYDITRKTHDGGTTDGGRKGTIYSNYFTDVGETGEEKKDATESLYDSEGNLARIRAVKAKFDPDNLFTRSVLPSV